MKYIIRYDGAQSVRQKKATKSIIYTVQLHRPVGHTDVLHIYQPKQTSSQQVCIIARCIQ